MPSNRKVRASYWTRPIAGIITAGLLATNTQVAAAQPLNPSDAQIRQAREAASNAESYLQSLVAEVTSSERRVSDLELRMGTLREDVNKAMVDLENARDAANRAREAVDEARTQLDRSRAELASAQKQFDELARTIMRQGRSSGSILEGARDASEAINRLSALRREADRQEQTVDSLDKNRTEAANQESTLRKKSDEAQQAEATANQRNTDAQNAYSEANEELQKEQADYRQAQVDRDAAKASLDAARNAVNELNSQRQNYENEQARKEAEDAAAKKAAEEAAAKTRAEAQSNQTDEDSSSESTDESSSTTGSTGSTGSNSSTDSAGSSSSTGSTGSSSSTGSTSSSETTESSDSSESTETSESSSTGSSSSSGTPAQTVAPTNPETGQSTSGSSSQKVETVIARAMGQLGVPYAWGGGNANGPTKGIRDGGVADSHGDYNKIGFDCSGLTLYAYAAVGIDLPHYTGYQYQRGKHYPASQMKRGDLLFWGPNGHGHVAIYLGDGKMIEAPQSGSVVKISPVRYNGMTPNVVRLV
ncbi:cell wall hydrolase [Corynebacterium sp. HMSC063G05]|uniref:DIP1281 family NlpC/P60 protein n=1 Tax=Corynebacterium sp. HMSC063G05 TaxID=1739255 RepID=UPI0008A1600F|nr:NlpC/P60 family protein [Corynebacterium sp. HMSC063G05]OFL72263.1 cell wall hydrolase [Corynebacterium sp. HMSC063G05]